MRDESRSAGSSLRRTLMNRPPTRRASRPSVKSLSPMTTSSRPLRSMPEMAKRLGRPVGALYKERQRAEESLRAFALSYDWSTS